LEIIRPLIPQRGGRDATVPIFSGKEDAEEHGFKLCKEWIDKRP